MARTAEDYLQQLQALSPRGAAWSRETGAARAKVLGAVADELARVDIRAGDAVTESDPRATLELLTDWERVAGLPDPCITVPDTIQERRAALVAKLTGRGGQSRQFFIDVAAALGFQVTVTDFTPFRTGLNATGDPLYGEDWWFGWQVNGPEATVREFRVGQSAVGEPLRDFGNEVLECVVERLKPAHTEVLFTYG